MSQTQSEAAVMEQTAARFDQTNVALQRMLTSLMSELEVLQTAWRGVGGRSFERVKHQWAMDQRTLSRALAETASAIRTARADYTASDTEAGSRMAATNGGLTLPL